MGNRNFNGLIGQGGLSSYRVTVFLISLMSLGVSMPLVAAPSVTVDVPLDFGVLAVKANGSVSTLSVNEFGSVSFTADVIPLGGIVKGEYRLTGFPPHMPLELQWDDVNLSAGGFGLPEFLLVTDYVNPVVVSDALGEAVVPVGATLKTSGSGTMYVDAPYSGTAQMRVRYWSAPDTAYIIHHDLVDISAQAQSAINLVQNQALSFGSLSAYSDPGAQATMTLHTNSTVDITNAGNAKMTFLGGAAAASIRVSGAAPYYGVTITPEPGNIFLTHVTPGGVARFIAGSFITSPAGSGRTDASGNLDILVGATLTTELTSNPYENGVYTGTYTLTVSY